MSLKERIESITEARVKELDAAFTRVCDPKNWKMPIDSVVEVDPADDLFKTLNDINEAVIHYTGSVPTIKEMNAKLRVFHVTAAGYYRTIGS